MNVIQSSVWDQMAGWKYTPDFVRGVLDAIK